MKKFILTGLIALSCFAQTVDSDFDGVPDNIDLCPNTPFLQTVNKYGCSKQQISQLNKIDYYASVGYEKDGYKNYKDSNVFFTSISARRNNLKAKLYFSVKDDGYSNGYKSNDLILAGYYYLNNVKNSNINLKLGAKIYLPTYFNDKTDYALYIKGTYYYKNYSFSLSEKHKIYGESGTNAKDTITASVGTTYKKLFISPYAYVENSAYDSGDWSKYLGMSVYYPINKKLGVLVDYSFDIEESANYTLIGSLGYSF
ncbi:hypothetical protein [Caminibacter pacificus]